MSTDKTAKCPVCGEPIRSFWDGLWHGLGLFVPCIVWRGKQQ